MEFRVLGPLEVLTEEGPQSLGGPRQRALLAILVLNANRVVSRDQLIDELWGADAPAAAGHALNVATARLRKLLGSADGQPRLITRPPGYLLRVEPGELDLEQFERRVDEGGAAAATGDHERAAAALREAEGLWRGRPLADLEFEPFARLEVERLQELRFAAVEERIEAELALGRHGPLVAELEALVEAHPLRERLRGQQIVALYRSGRQADALQAYREARGRLVGDLGIEPGPALQRLERAVLEHDPSLGAPDGLPSAPAVRPGRPPQPPAPRGGGHRRRAVLALAGGGLLLGAALATLLLTAGSRPQGRGPHRLTANSLVAIDPREGVVVADVPVGRTPTSVAVGADAVWSLNADDRTIARLDLATRHVQSLGLGVTPTDLAAGAGALWVGTGGSTGFGAEQVLRLDPDDLVTQARIALPPGHHQGAPGQPGQLAVGAGAVWAINRGEDLARIDPATGRVTAVVRPLRARAVAVSGHSVWVLTAANATIVRVDPRTARVWGARLKIPAARLDAIAAGAGAVWAPDAYDGTLWRIDPGPVPVTRTIPVGVGVDGVAVGAGAVWVTNSLGGTVVRVDPATNRVVRTIATGGTPRDVSVGAGRVWVSLAGGGGVVAAPSSSATGPRAVQGSSCGPVFSGGGRPDHLIVSDLPLKGGVEFGTLQIARAVAFELRQHGFRAGRYRLGYESCDASSAASGESDPKKCEANAKAYAADPAVLGVVGPYQSSCALAEVPILNAAPGGPVAVVSPSNSLVGLTHADPLGPPGSLARMYPTGVRNYARLYPADDAEAAADALLARQLHVRRLYVLDDGNAPGRELALYVRRSARAIGLHVAGTARWDAAGTGFAALAERVARARADGVFLGGLSGSNGGPLVRALRARLGRRSVLIGATPFAPVDFIYKTSHGAVRGMYLSDPGLANARLGARGRRFLSDFAATQPDGRIGSFAVFAAAATEVLLDAIAHSDGTRASVARRLLATQLRDSILGPVRFDRNGDMVAPPVTIMRVRARSGVSDVPTYEGAIVDGVISPPRSAIR